MSAHVVDHLAHACEQLGIFEDGFAHGDAVATELAGFAKKPRRVGKRPDGHGSVVRRHAAELRPGHEHRPGTQLRRPEGGQHTGGSRTNDDNVHHASSARYSTPALPGAGATMSQSQLRIRWI